MAPYNTPPSPIGDVPAATKAYVDDALSGVSSGGGNVFVFQPGGTPGGNVYDDWATLMAAVATAPAGYKMIAFDESFNNILIPEAGSPWDVTDCELYVSAKSAGHTQVHVEPDTTFIGLRKWRGKIQFILDSSGGGGVAIPVTDFNTSGHITILEGAIVESFDPDTPIFESDGHTVSIELDGILGGNGGEGGGPTVVWNAAAIGTSVSITFINDARLEANAFQGDNGNSLSYYVVSPGARIFDQTNWNGDESMFSTPAGRHNVVLADSSPWSADYGETTLVPEAPYTIDLPELFDPETNCLENIIKNDSDDVSTITINPAVGQTIDGAASTSISSARGVVTLVAFGTDWKVLFKS
jgi:hypothetical protein